jgi:hypothetical protein
VINNKLFVVDLFLQLFSRYSKAVALDDCEAARSGDLAFKKVFFFCVIV